MKVKFFSPDDHVSFDNVISISMDGPEGKFMVLANHAPFLISTLSGVMVIKIINQKEEKIMIDNGVLEVAGNECNILTKTFSLHVNEF
ncbi:MAG: hypothetical protein QWI36_04815 [Wolbachia endosymbiont of Tyrophagus putrescentiae]|nr:hypothetical protein [Wolbachia endosymbiont of Tyrophagus putrescentiae]